MTRFVMSDLSEACKQSIALLVGLRVHFSHIHLLFQFKARVCGARRFAEARRHVGEQATAIFVSHDGAVHILYVVAHQRLLRLVRNLPHEWIRPLFVEFRAGVALRDGWRVDKKVLQIVHVRTLVKDGDAEPINIALHVTTLL